MFEIKCIAQSTSKIGHIFPGNKVCITALNIQNCIISFQLFMDHQVNFAQLMQKQFLPKCNHK